MPKKSEFTEAVQDVVQEWKKAHERPTTGIPLGQERVSKQTARARLAKMSPLERQALVDRVGIDAVMEMLE